MFYRRTARRAAIEGCAAPRRRAALARLTTRAVLPVAAVGGLAGLSLAAPAVTAAAPAAAHLTSVRVVPAIGHPILGKALTAPIPTTQCQSQLKIACYSPVQYRVAYDLNPLYHAGITGPAGPSSSSTRSAPPPSRPICTSSTSSGGSPTPTCR